MEVKEEAVLIESKAGWILDFTKGYKFAEIQNVCIYENSEWRYQLDRRNGLFLKNVKFTVNEYANNSNSIRIFADLREFIYCRDHLSENNVIRCYSLQGDFPECDYIKEEDRCKFIQEEEIVNWIHPKKLVKERFFLSDVYEEDTSSKRYYYNSWLEYKETKRFEMVLSNCSIFLDGEK